MDNNAIEVKNVVVGYRNLEQFSIKQSLLLGKLKKPKMFIAVDDVSFNVKKGEVIGIVGKNGSGKSTLLRTIAGIFSPDQGSIEYDGTISLLSLGVGFNQRLSGRENIILSGLLLGFSEVEIEEKMEDIIQFSELGEFIDKPVRTYSSGMFSKLAFSITVILETDIILIDEVLSVGDENFKVKSFSKINDLISHRDRTVLIVSHNLNQLREISDRVLWIHDGKVKRDGKTDEVIDEYVEFMK